MKKVITVSDIVGTSKSVKAMAELIERVAKTKTNVLVSGESGTGKELVARAIHYGSALKDKPFVAINCGAIPENLIESELFGHKKGSFTGASSDKDGLFKVADGGTIFLDEIGELPLSMQVKLLRVLQERNVRPVGSNESIKIDARVISATNRDLEKEIVAGRFREDLYYRLNVINIKTPALRDRKDDLPKLIDHFIKKFSTKFTKQMKGVSEEAMAAMTAYDFPGNIRELENMIERSIALENGDILTVETLPPQLKNIAGKVSSSKTKGQVFEASPVDRVQLWKSAAAELDGAKVNLDKILEEVEREYVVKALEKTGGVKKKAAELLGVTFRSMRYRIEKFGIADTEGDVEE